MFEFINYSKEDALASAEKVLALETQLATPRLDKVQSRDIRNFNNPKSVQELNAMTPAFDWTKFMKDLGVSEIPEQVIVMQPKYMAELNSFLTSTAIDDLKTLMTWSTLDNAAGYLTTEIEKANWNFTVKPCVVLSTTRC